MLASIFLTDQGVVVCIHDERSSPFPYLPLVPRGEAGRGATTRTPIAEKHLEERRGREARTRGRGRGGHQAVFCGTSQLREASHSGGVQAAPPGSTTRARSVQQEAATREGVLFTLVTPPLASLITRSERRSLLYFAGGLADREAREVIPAVIVHLCSHGARNLGLRLHSAKAECGSRDRSLGGAGAAAARPAAAVARPAAAGDPCDD